MTTTRQDTRLWHPFADMAAVRDAELIIDRAEGVWVWDRDGRRYLDATSSLWYANVGHGRAEIADAVHAQLRKLDAYSVFGDFSNEPARAVAERLAAVAPVPDARIFLTNGGGDSIDTAAKLARQYWSVCGRPGKVRLLSRIGGFHGTHGFGTSLVGIEANRSGFGPLLEHASLVPHDSAEALEREILRYGAESVAAFFVEPVIGAGGVHPPPPGYVEEVADICERHDVLLVVDAVICAFGRLGGWFGVERWGIQPDMIAFAKGVTSGYQPLGGVAISGRIAEPFWEQPGHVVRHGGTYAGHPAACAAALANFDILEREGLISRGAELEQPLLDRLTAVVDHPLVAEVRGGTGLMAAVEIAPEALAEGLATADLAAAAREHGIFVRPLGSSIAVSPPLIVTDEQLDLIGVAIAATLDTVADRLGV